MPCNHENESFSKFCTTCGESIERQMCHCGGFNLLQNIFCFQCGVNLASLHEKNDFREKSQLKKIMLKDLLHGGLGEEDDSQNDSQTISQDDIDNIF